jgi:hypothetical protein
MRINGELVKLDGKTYREHVELMHHQREILRCLTVLDITGMRKVWREMSPHLDQPGSDWEALHIMHEARVRMATISPQQKRYSEHWLREHKSKTHIAAAVGIIVKSMSSAGRERARDVQGEMSEAVLLAVRDGVDIEHEIAEMHDRMMRAKQRVIRR